MAEVVSVEVIETELTLKFKQKEFNTLVAVLGISTDGDVKKAGTYLSVPVLGHQEASNLFDSLKTFIK